MAKKKEPSVEDAVKIFHDVMHRASLSDYLYVNKTMISKNPKGNSVIITPEQELWLKIIDDPEMQAHLTELMPSDPEYNEKPDLCNSVELDSNVWIDVDSDIFYKGKICKISVKGFNYDIPINRGLLPLKLRKAEYNNISYCVLTNPILMLMLRKKFEFPAINGCGFTMYRMFQII